MWFAVNPKGKVLTTPGVTLRIRPPSWRMYNSPSGRKVTTVGRETAALTAGPGRRVQNPCRPQR